MKQFKLVLLLLAVGFSVNAQDFKKVNTFLVLNKTEDARAELEKMWSDPKNQNAEGWLYRARIYGAIYANPELSAKYPDAESKAFEAFDKYMSLDPEAKALSNAGMNVVDQLYVTSYNAGRTQFDEKKFDSALISFKKAAKMGDYITDKNWKSNKQTIDTFTVLLAAYSAQNSNNAEEAVKFYSQLAEQKVNGENFEAVYDYLVRHYLRNPDKEKFNQYVALGKQFYPNQPLWKQAEMAYLTDNSTLAEKYKMYEDKRSAGNLTAEEYETFGYMFSTVRQADVADSAAYVDAKSKALDAYKNAYNIDSSSGVTAFNVGVLIANDWEVLMDRYRANAGTSAASKAKRDEIDRMAKAKAIESVNWLEKSFNQLSPKAEKTREEKNVLSNNVKLLANLYEYLRDRSKGVAADYDKYNNKFNTYDQLVGKPF